MQTSQGRTGRIASLFIIINHCKIFLPHLQGIPSLDTGMLRSEFTFMVRFPVVIYVDRKLRFQVKIRHYIHIQLYMMETLTSDFRKTLLGLINQEMTNSSVFSKFLQIQNIIIIHILMFL